MRQCANSLALLLESAGFSVRAYDSAAAFLRAASDLTAGCVLTDVQMPELNGLELQRRMSELGIRLPVIVMTGHGDVPIAVEALKAGATDFLEKPFEEQHLLAAVASAIAVSQRGARRGGRGGGNRRANRHADAARASRCWTIWWPASRTRRSPTTWVPARVPSKCIGRG